MEMLRGSSQTETEKSEQDDWWFPSIFCFAQASWRTPSNKQMLPWEQKEGAL